MSPVPLIDYVRATHRPRSARALWIAAVILRSVGDVLSRSHLRLYRWSGTLDAIGDGKLR